MNRRTFLARLIKLFFSLLLIVFGAVSTVFLYPARIRKRTLQYIEVMEEEELPGRGVKAVLFSYSRNGHSFNTQAYIVNHKDALFTLSPVCSHLGCLVIWHRTRERFICPCHSGEYDIEGNVVAGPPPAPLKRLPMEIRGGKVYVGVRV